MTHFRTYPGIIGGVVCYCRIGRDHPVGHHVPAEDGECDSCGDPAPVDELYECASSVPWQPAERHCIVCFVECGPCRDAAALEWQAEHGIPSRRRS